MTNGPDGSPGPFRWWVWLLPDVFLVMPLGAAIFGGVGAVLLLREEPAAGSSALAAWLAYLLLGVRFVVRRRYASFGFALTVALLGLAFAVAFAILP